jgi:hypothetical protein
MLKRVDDYCARFGLEKHLLNEHPPEIYERPTSTFFSTQMEPSTSCTALLSNVLAFLASSARKNTAGKK